nr:NAD-dependent epimerase/dehydratase family protein [Microvirga sp. BSC39]
MNIALDDDPRNLTVLVTGIGGFLAGHIALQLLEQGYQFRGSLRHVGESDAIRDELGSHSHSDVAEKLSFVRADLDSDDGWAAAVKDCRYVIHTASSFPPGFQRMSVS